MAKSNLDIFKIGVGPSSSHTLGPMLAAAAFLEVLGDKLTSCTRVVCTLYGSLSLTGRGHLTDKAVLWGLSGLKPAELTRKLQQQVVSKSFTEHRLNLGGRREIHFDYRQDLIFSKDFRPEHQNALTFAAFDGSGSKLAEETYFSTGGGFIKTLAQMQQSVGEDEEDSFADLFSIDNTKVALRLCQDDDLSLAALSLRYELQFHEQSFIEDYCAQIWQVMQEAYQHGLTPDNPYLPGSLHLKRRAPDLLRQLDVSTEPFAVIDQVSLYAMSIAEENASGAKVVTAPTNGACGVVPAVLLYLKDYLGTAFTPEVVRDYLLTAMLIGSFYKNNATISGAEGGCQAEIGSASSMAAAAMTTVLGGDAFKACSAAEIAMEHHLGLTCDPVDGLVQIPCIERNAFGAVKAITAARISSKRQSQPRVSLDEVIKTMYLTGKDISFKYKETALGGLAELQLDN